MSGISFRRQAVPRADGRPHGGGRVGLKDSTTIIMLTRTRTLIIVAPQGFKDSVMAPRDKLVDKWVYKYEGIDDPDADGEGADGKKVKEKIV